MAVPAMSVLTRAVRSAARAVCARLGHQWSLSPDWDLMTCGRCHDEQDTGALSSWVQLSEWHDGRGEGWGKTDSRGGWGTDLSLFTDYIEPLERDRVETP
jgi:hypothetical protein